jgi:3-vinyl bacteriochlorophyllide hydratase
MLPNFIKGQAVSGDHMTSTSRTAQEQIGLYTPEQRVRRDNSIWTTVQAILAPLQFAVFLVSLVLVLRYLTTGAGYEIATVSIIAKTFLLYLIMVTGAIWEKVVFGQWLFAPAFFWEDVISFVVIGLHTLYLYGLLTGSIGPEALIVIVLMAYATYVVNAGQFLWKLRAARLQSELAA